MATHLGDELYTLGYVAFAAPARVGTHRRLSPFNGSASHFFFLAALSVSPSLLLSGRGRVYTWKPCFAKLEQGWKKIHAVQQIVNNLCPCCMFLWRWQLHFLTLKSLHNSSRHVCRETWNYVKFHSHTSITEVSIVCPEGFHHQRAGLAREWGGVAKSQLQWLGCTHCSCAKR